MPVTPCRPKWKSSMTDRERFNNQMHYRPVDRCFNMEFGWWEENFHQWDLFVKNGVTTNEEGDVFFNFDRIERVSPRTWMYPVFKRETVEETPTTLIVRSEGGLLVEVPKDGHDTIPHYIGSTIKTPDDWKHVKEERFRVDNPARDLDVDALKAKHPPDPRLSAWHPLRLDDRRGPQPSHLRGPRLRLL